MRGTYVILSKKLARAYGVIHCTCGHPHNNHFSFGSKPCAHCNCKKLNETLVPRGAKVVKQGQQ